MNLLDETMDSIRDQVNEGITPNCLLIKEEIYQKLIDHISAYMPTHLYTLDINIRTLAGLKVHVVESLPNDADVIAVYIPEGEK